MTSETLTRVLLAVADPVFRAGLAMMIDGDDALHLAGEADHDAELVLPLPGDPDVVLLDLHLPDGDLPTRVRQLAAAHRVVVLAKYPDETLIDGALLAGAADFVVRTMSPEQILAALSGAGPAQYPV